MKAIFISVSLGWLTASFTGVLNSATVATPAGFDIREFALPNCLPGEIWFEESRDIEQLVLPFADHAPDAVTISYQQRSWPERRGAAGNELDGWFNQSWKKADVNTTRIDAKTLLITFKGLRSEFREAADYDVAFRRTCAIKIDAETLPQMDEVRICTTSKPMTSTLRVELDAGKPTAAKHFTLSGYNTRIEKISAKGGNVSGGTWTPPPSGERSFIVDVEHLRPTGAETSDGGDVTFATDEDTFTISLDALAKEGPIWFEDQGIYITDVNNNTTFERYKSTYANAKNIAQQVVESREQTLGGAMNGQPRPHPVAFHLGRERARQRFWLESNGDVVMRRQNVDLVEGRDSKQFKNGGGDAHHRDGRFLFGLERWNRLGQFPDATQMASYTILLRNEDLELEEKSLAAPLCPPPRGAELAGDDTIVALVRFRFRNNGAETINAELPIAYSSSSGISDNLRANYVRFTFQTDDLVPIAKEDPLSIAELSEKSPTAVIRSRWNGEDVIRALVTGDMTVKEEGGRVKLSRELKPGESCEVLIKVPFVAVDSAEDLAKLEGMDFDTCEREGQAFWRAELAAGASVQTPEPRLNLWHRAHLGHVQISGIAMPGKPELISTCVGTSYYHNYCNEACMIIEDLDERGLHEEARRRLSIWLNYQGTQGLNGNFTDHDGVFFGAGGFEAGKSYNQHHGWILWCLSKHYFATHDKVWLEENAQKLIDGVDWVFRQRKHTMAQLPHSRGWEHGFLPAGGLEDVNDYCYWLSTNTMTWRGTEWVARVLEDIGHPQAARVRAESDAYCKDLIRGFEKARQHTPLVKLQDGRWVPNYPSRLYRRGRDVGWVREVLEGSLYLLISGLYDPKSKQAAWILDDYQDNRYPDPVYSFSAINRHAWFYEYGFSGQPNLLAGLMPYLDRDEPEIYIWMFFNAWASCYREETNGLQECPKPALGYSTSSGIKTSDESNPCKWLRYMFVYPSGNTLFLGRAIPRDWFKADHAMAVKGAITPFGTVSVDYRPALSENKITLMASLPSKRSPAHIVARFRHPDELPIKSVIVDGKNYKKFDAVKGDVDLSGLSGDVVVDALY